MLNFDERDRENVLRDLESPDDEVRRLAVERIEALSANDVISRLVERLGDTSWRVRKTAVERLVAWPDTDGVADALIGALADGDNPGRRNAAVEALVHNGSKMVPKLIEATQADDADVRKFVVDALAGIGAPAAVPSLVACLEDSDPNVCAAAADALGAIDGDHAISALKATAIDSARQSLVRFSALHALAALEVPIRACELADVLADPVLRAGGLALLGCAEDDAQALEILLKGLSSGSRAPREASQRSLLRLLARSDGAAADRIVERIRATIEESPEVVEHTVGGLEGSDLATQLVLIQFLGLLSDKRAVVPVLLAGRDEALSEVALAALKAMGPVVEDAIEEAWSGLASEARHDACVLLGDTRGEPGASRLIGALDESDSAIRTAAARSIGRRRLEAALAPLIRRLEISATDDDLESDEERAAVTEALVALVRGNETSKGAGDLADCAIEKISALIDGANDTVRLAAATVLGCIGRTQDLEIVCLLLKDASADVRRAAVDALSRLDPEAAAEPLRLAIADEAPAVRIAAAAALGASLRPELFEDLHRLTEDDDARVRATAVHVLGKRFLEDPDPGRRAAAMAVMHRARDDEAPVALAVIEAAREVGVSAATHVVPLLRRHEPEVVRDAVRCLGMHASGRELDAIVPLVSHPDWSVRAETIQVLAERGVRNAVPAILRRLELEQDEFVRSITLRALDKLEA
jgi:HEAT repeat protein